MQTPSQTSFLGGFTKKLYTWSCLSPPGASKEDKSPINQEELIQTSPKDTPGK